MVKEINMEVSTESKRIAALDFVLRLIVSAPDDVDKKDMDGLLSDATKLYRLIQDKEQADFVRLTIEEDMASRKPLLHDKLPFYLINGPWENNPDISDIIKHTCEEE